MPYREPLMVVSLKVQLTLFQIRIAGTFPRCWICFQPRGPLLLTGLGGVPRLRQPQLNGWLKILALDMWRLVRSTDRPGLRFSSAPLTAFLWLKRPNSFKPEVSFTVTVQPMAHMRCCWWFQPAQTVKSKLRCFLPQLPFRPPFPPLPPTSFLSWVRLPMKAHCREPEIGGRGR